MSIDRLSYTQLIGGTAYGSAWGLGQRSWQVSMNENYANTGNVGSGVQNIIDNNYTPTLSTEYAGYFGLDVKKDLVNNKIITRYNPSGNTNNAITDVSIAALKVKINKSLTANFSEGDSYTQTIEYAGKSPDCFFFYNPFNLSRLRIHSMGVKKVR